DSVVQVDQQLNVLDTILLHSLLCFRVACNNLLPQVKSFVLYLTIPYEKRSDIGQLVHVKPKLLYCLEDINTCYRRRRSKICQKDLSSELGDVVLVSVV